MKPAPRPPARRLLAGRFLVPRASLLALPDGPVAGLDLATGELVGLAFGPSAQGAGAIAARICRWNELGPAPIHELHRHLGRPLVSFGLPSGGGGELAQGELEDQARALGGVLDAAGLGLPCGPADLALGSEGPYLRRPAIWPADPEQPLARRLPELASRLLERVPAQVAQAALAPRGRLRVALGRAAPGTRRTRAVLVIACAVLSAVAVSSLTASSHGGAIARAAPLPRPAIERPPTPTAAAPRRFVPRRRAAAAVSRGGPARVLSFPPAPAPAAATVLRPVARVVPVTVRPRADAPARGWVEGLFAGS